MPYTLNEIQYPSVTSILGQLDKPALTFWAANCAVDWIEDHLEDIQDPSGPHTVDHIMREARRAFQKASDKAKDIGTMTHDAIEQYIKHGKDAIGELPDGVEHSLLAFWEWESKNNVEWEESELTLFNTKAGYCGTCDAVAVVNGHRYIVDLKTSKGIYDEYHFQLAAYLFAYNSMHPDKPLENCAVLRLDKFTGEPEWRDVGMKLNTNYRYFIGLTNLYYMAKKRRLKNNPFVEAYWPKGK